MNLKLKNYQETASERFAFDLMDALRSPILTFSQVWADCIPKRLLDLVTPARLIMNIKNEKTASLPEVVTYIMTRTFLSPMSHEWTQIYCWASCTVSQFYWQEDHWNDIFSKDDRRTLSQQEEYELKKLRLWIYQKRREILKDRIKKSERKKVIDPKPPAIKENNLWNFS